MIDRISLMVGIIDYNAGNIKSVEHALEALKAPFILSKSPMMLKNVDRIIFPGVGDAAFAMQQLKETGFDSFLRDWAASGKPMAGICLGSQIIFEHSDEGDVECLGLLEGDIRHFSTLYEERELPYLPKIPHMGWNDVTFVNGGCKYTENVKDKSDFYFVHSYVIQPRDPSIIKGYADYGTMVPAIVEKDNICVFQFHPEKSGKAGLQILKNFVMDDLDPSERGPIC